MTAIPGFRQLLDPGWTQVFVQELSCFRIGQDPTGTQNLSSHASSMSASVVMSFRVRAPFVVLAFGAVGATGALGYAHSVLRLGLATVCGLSGGYPVLILLGNSSVARLGIHGSGRAIGACGHTRSIRGLGLTTICGLSGRYSIRILVGGSSVARVRVVSSGSLTILTNSFTAFVLDAILRK
jgi:hypothetical protein